MFQIQKLNINVLDSISEENLSKNPENSLIPNKTWEVSPEKFSNSISLISFIPVLSSYHFILTNIEDNLLISFSNQEIQFYSILPLNKKGFSEEELKQSKTYLCELSQFVILSNPKTPFHFQFEDKEVFFVTENLKHKVQLYSSQSPISFPPTSLSYSDFKIQQYLKSLISFFSLSASLSEDIVEVISGNIFMNGTIFTVKIQDPNLILPESVILRSFCLKAIFKMGENLKIASSGDKIYLKENSSTLSLPRIQSKVDISFIPDREINFLFQINRGLLAKAFKTSLALKSRIFGFTIEKRNFYLRTSSKTEFILPVLFLKGNPTFVTDLPTVLFSRILSALPKDENISFSVTRTYIEIQVQTYTVRISRFIPI